jgi:hypothetical protein
MGKERGGRLPCRERNIIRRVGEMWKLSTLEAFFCGFGNVLVHHDLSHEWFQDFHLIFCGCLGLPCRNRDISKIDLDRWKYYFKVILK